MKKIIGILLAITMIVCMFTVFAPSKVTEVDAATRNLGTMYVSKLNGLWTDYQNRMILISPGNTVDGKYFHKLYAVYDSSAGGYVIQNKVASHIGWAKTVASNAIGISFNYDPANTTGASEALANFKIWQKLRVGDVLTLSGIDLANNTIDTSGTWGTSSFKSNAKISAKTSRPLPSGTSYSDKVIVALGDSVTANGGWTEGVEDKISGTVINAGINGNKVDQALTRFERDVQPYNPDIVLVMFAINDVVTVPYNNTNVVTYKNNLQTLHDKCKAIGAKVIFMTPNDINISALDYDRYSAYGGLAVCYKLFRDTMKQVASANGCFCIDNYAKWESINTNDYLMDTVHPTGEGYQIYTDNISAFLINNSQAITGQSFKVEMALTSDAARTCTMTSDGYLTGIKPNMTVAQVKALFSTNVTISGSVIATGTQVNGVDSSGKVIKTVTIIIKGDINCDGKMDQTDILKIKSILKKTSSGDSAAALKAADASGNGKINVTDYIAMKRQVLGTMNLYN